jgi:ribosomal protein S18
MRPGSRAILPTCVAAQRIARVHADAHNVSRLNRLRHNLLQRFIDKNGIARHRGVAAASTNNHRGVMTAVPKELSLGFTR